MARDEKKNLVVPAANPAITKGGSGRAQLGS